jgi:transcriptional regulator with XRE-family HTH domain
MTTVATADPFADALRRWRARRRWSQLELAVRAETTQRHVSFIEQGRSRPGRALVVRLAESLGLSLRERNELLLAAGFAPVYAETPIDAPLLRPVREAIRHVLAGHMPYPALVARPYGQIVDANDAITVLTDGAAPELVTPPFNVLRLALHPNGMAPRVINLSEWGRHITASLRNQAARSPDHELDSFIEELEGYLPDDPTSRGHLGFAVPLRLRSDDCELRLITTLSTFATAADVTIAELHLEAFLPADQDTADHLRHRAALTWGAATVTAQD